MVRRIDANFVAICMVVMCVGSANSNAGGTVSRNYIADSFDTSHAHLIRVVEQYSILIAKIACTTSICANEVANQCRIERRVGNEHTSAVVAADDISLRFRSERPRISVKGPANIEIREIDLCRTRHGNAMARVCNAGVGGSIQADNISLNINGVPTFGNADGNTVAAISGNEVSFSFSAAPDINFVAGNCDAAVSIRNGERACDGRAPALVPMRLARIVISCRAQCRVIC